MKKFVAPLMRPASYSIGGWPFATPWRKRAIDTHQEAQVQALLMGIGIRSW